MKSRPGSLMILIVFAFGCMYLLDSCSSSKPSASYPVIHKLKNEKFAKNIKPKNKIENIGKSRILVQRNDNKPDVNAFADIDQDEIQTSSGESTIIQEYTADTGPDIASVNNDLIYSNNSITTDDQFFKASNYYQRNSFKLTGRNFFSKKSGNHFESDHSNSRRGNDSPALGIAAFVIGVLGLLVPVGFAIILGIIAAVFGALGANKKLKGFAIAGLILGLICILFGLILL